MYIYKGVDTSRFTTCLTTLNMNPPHSRQFDNHARVIISILKRYR